jgi:hypothetical protein
MAWERKQGQGEKGERDPEFHFVVSLKFCVSHGGARPGLLTGFLLNAMRIISSTQAEMQCESMAETACHEGAAVFPSGRVFAGYGIALQNCDFALLLQPAR